MTFIVFGGVTASQIKISLLISIHILRYYNMPSEHFVTVTLCKIYNCKTLPKDYFKYHITFLSSL